MSLTYEAYWIMTSYLRAGCVAPFHKGWILSKPVGCTVHEHGTLAVTRPSKGVHNWYWVMHALTALLVCCTQPQTLQRFTFLTGVTKILTTLAPQQLHGIKKSLQWQKAQLLVLL